MMALGAWLAVDAKGGHNGESYNHNDVGNFLVYIDGQPLLVDAGVETYTRKTFSAERYDIWTMQSAYHSLLPTIDGVQQAPGRSFAARDVGYGADESTARFSLDIAGAYPPEARLKSWRRTITLHRGQEVEIVDDGDNTHRGRSSGRRVGQEADAVGVCGVESGPAGHLDVSVYA